MPKPNTSLYDAIAARMKESPLTVDEAFIDFGIANLSTTIVRMRKAGLTVHQRLIKGNKRQVVEYWMNRDE